MIVTSPYHDDAWRWESVAFAQLCGVNLAHFGQLGVDLSKSVHMEQQFVMIQDILTSLRKDKRPLTEPRCSSYIWSPEIIISL